MKKIIFFLTVLLSIPTYSNIAKFPPWFSPNSAKIYAIKHFITEMSIEKETLYQISELDLTQKILESGEKGIEVNLLFKTDKCIGRKAIFKWRSSQCSNLKCKPYLEEIGKCPQTI
ncbi:MAG: hypothetical protein DRQ88_00090 [Epsilonproteobacteria bacterium]|nr:MAG: hypothetical protein DRQ89_10665 [Campylobacterota bacterium]RLA68036.1 MAG: hypothetical protein DRQ88_00090 [Campylobacterota bacterium]